MADTEHFEETTVDDSKLKLPDVKLDKVETKTLEEDEEVLYSQRAKLYRHDMHFHTKKKEWKERGTGTVKILKHKTHGKIRLLMRQDKTLKICANHLIDPKFRVSEHPSSDKALLFGANDFADEELKQETFCIRFRDHETAMAFKAAHDSACEVMATFSGEAGAAPEEDKGDEDEDADAVPVTDSLDDIYTDEASLAVAKARVAAMTKAFAERFDGAVPNFFVRAPGRVNLIGEHIDYHGYSVLPMAISNDILIAVAVGAPEDEVKIENMHTRFGSGSIPGDFKAPVELDGDVKWFQYFQCGYKAAFDARGEGDSRQGMRVLIDGNIPPGGGLSSSSAFVVASTLATACANGIQLTRTQVAESAILAERYCGTMGGGMDQTISACARAGSAAVIDFNPLRSTPVTLPAGSVFVVGHSLIESPKAVRPWEGYNHRVVEGKLGAKLVAKKAGVEDWIGVKTVLELQQALGKSAPAELESLIAEHIPEGDFTVDTLKSTFGTEDLGSLFAGDPKQAGVVQVLENQTSFALLQRTRHVAAEAARVHKFAELCNGELTDETLVALGGLMDASHASCSGDYACSIPQLDELVALARSSGAVGARLTGAGWGGCMVALVPAAKVEPFRAALVDGFYGPKGVTDLSTKLFVSSPGSGCAIYLPNSA